MKTRHGCATVYLVLGILGGVLGLLNPNRGFQASSGDPQMEEAMAEMAPGMTPQVEGLMTVLGFLGVACLIGIWMWKRWGFYGYLLQQVVALVLVTIVFGPQFRAIAIGGQALGVGVFLLAMFIGSPNTAEQLE